MSGSSGGATTTTQSGPSPQILANYQALTNAGEAVASNPLQQYSSPLVNGFSPQQQSGFQTIANSQGDATPYINAASQEFGAATTPLWPTLPQFSADTVNQYMSPYTSDVTGALTNLYNSQNATQQSQIAGNAAAQNSYGGDRTAVAQALAAQQENLAQAPTLANVQQQGYQSGTTEFNTEQAQQLAAEQANSWLNSQAAFGLGSLGTEAQNTALTGASANIGAGAQQQQLGQEQLNVPYQQFLQQQQYPYQQLSFLSPIVEGTGSLSGGTGATTSPGPSTLSQIGGLGLAGAGAYGLYNQLSGSGTNYVDPSIFSGGSTGTLTNLDGSSLFGKRGGAVADHAHRMGGGGIGSSGMSMPAVPGIGAGAMIGGGVPNIDLSYIPQPAAGGSPSSFGLSVNQPVVTQTSSGGGGGASGILGDIGAIANIGRLFLKDGGRMGFDGGGMVTNPGTVANAGTAGIGGLPTVPSINLDFITKPPAAQHGSGPPHAPNGTPAPNTANDMQTMLSGAKSLQGAGLLDWAKGDSPPAASGGRIGHFDAGGAAAAPLGAAINFGGAPPNQTQSYQQLLELPINRLQEMAVQYPPTSQQGQLVQRAIQQKQMTPGSGTAPTQGGIGSAQQQPAGQQPSSAVPSGTSQLATAPQDYGGTAHAMAIGGNADDPGYVTPDELDPHPEVDHSGDTVKIRYPSEGKVLDLGLPSIPSQRPRRAAGGGSGGSATFPEISYGANGQWSLTPGSLGSGTASPAPASAPAGGGSGGAAPAGMAPPIMPAAQPGFSFTQAPNGASLPIMSPSLANATPNAQPGGGIGNWFQPLGQYQPPGAGTTGPGGSMVFPSNTAYLPNDAGLLSALNPGGALPTWAGGSAASATPSGTAAQTPTTDPTSPFFDPNLGLPPGKRGGNVEHFDDGGAVADIPPLAVADIPPAAVSDSPAADSDMASGIGAPKQDAALRAAINSLRRDPGLSAGIGSDAAIPAGRSGDAASARPSSDRSYLVPDDNRGAPPSGGIGAAVSKDQPPALSVPASLAIGNAPAQRADTPGAGGIGAAAAEPSPVMATAPIPPSIPSPADLPASIPRGTAAPAAPVSRETPTASAPSASSPSPSPAQWTAVGDSIGTGYIRFGGVGGKWATSPADTNADAAVSRTPKQVLDFITTRPNGYFAGKPVILSTGVSNDPSQVALVSDQIKALRAAGATQVQVAGVGNRPGIEGGKQFDLRPYNPQIENFVKAADDPNVRFGGPLPAVVHPQADYYRSSSQMLAPTASGAPSTAAQPGARIDTDGKIVPSDAPRSEQPEAAAPPSQGAITPGIAPGAPREFTSAGQTNVQTVINTAKNEAHLSDAATKGILANGLGEGGFNTPWQKSWGDENSFGHWQFNQNGELPGYLGWIKAQGLPNDSRAQTLYVAKRMEELHPGFSQITDPKQATDLVATLFEKYKGAAPGQRYGLLANADRVMNGDYSVPLGPTGGGGGDQLVSQGRGVGAQLASYSGGGDNPLTLGAAAMHVAGQPNSGLPSNLQSVLDDIQNREKNSSSSMYKSPWMLMLAVGAGMLASRSPFPGVALGEGLKTGLALMGEQQKNIPENELKQAQADAARISAAMVPARMQAGIDSARAFTGAGASALAGSATSTATAPPLSSGTGTGAGAGQEVPAGAGTDPLAPAAAALSNVANIKASGADPHQVAAAATNAAQALPGPSRAAGDDPILREYDRNYAAIKQTIASVAPFEPDKLPGLMEQYQKLFMSDPRNQALAERMKGEAAIGPAAGKAAAVAGAELPAKKDFAQFETGQHIAQEAGKAGYELAPYLAALPNNSGTMTLQAPKSQVIAGTAPGQKEPLPIDAVIPQGKPVTPGGRYDPDPDSLIAVAPPPGVTAIKTDLSPGAHAKLEEDNKTLEGYRKNAQDTPLQLHRIDNLSELLDKTQTGRLPNAGYELAAWAKSAGLGSLIPQGYDPSNVEEIKKLTTQLVFSQIKQIGGKVLVSEIEGLSQANPNVSLTLDANRAILQNLRLEQGLAQDRYVNASKVFSRYKQLGNFDEKYISNTPTGELEQNIHNQLAPAQPAKPSIPAGYPGNAMPGPGGVWFVPPSGPNGKWQKIVPRPQSSP